MTITKSGAVWVPHVRTAVTEIDRKFPGTSAGTYPGHDPDDSLAADFMIPRWETNAGKAVGSALAASLANVSTCRRLGIWYIIWNGRIWSMTRPSSGWLTYNPPAAAIRRNAASAYHRNHVHVSWYATPPANAQPTFLPVHYVDPAKVSTVLLGNKEGRDPKERPPGYEITTGVRIVKDGDRRWLVTDAGYAYDMAFLTTRKPAGKPDPEPPKPDPLLRVAFWNTRRASYAADEGTPRDWEHRDGLARDFLKSIPVPDVLATCETTREQTADIARFTGMLGIGNGLGGHPRDVANDNNSVFLGSKVERQQVVTVHTTSSANRRYLLAVKVRVKDSGAVLWLAATHLNRGTTNAAQEKETRELLDAAKAAGVDMSRLILGLDANDSATVKDPGVRRAAKASHNLTDWRDRLTDAQFRGDSWDTFTGWDADVEKTGRHIDTFLLGSAVTITKGEIVPVRNGASDHHLLLCSIR